MKKKKHFQVVVRLHTRFLCKAVCDASIVLATGCARPRGIYWSVRRVYVLLKDDGQSLPRVQAQEARALFEHFGRLFLLVVDWGGLRFSQKKTHACHAPFGTRLTVHHHQGEQDIARVEGRGGEPLRHVFSPRGSCAVLRMDPASRVSFIAHTYVRYVPLLSEMRSCIILEGMNAA